MYPNIQYFRGKRKLRPQHLGTHRLENKNTWQYLFDGEKSDIGFFDFTLNGESKLQEKKGLADQCPFA